LVDGGHCVEFENRVGSTF
jgi:hypothetical protein